MPYPSDTILAGKLRVIRLLGEGGLGEVYEVEHQLTRHRRALKVLKQRWRSDEELVRRFLREASAAGHIGNQHIVETFDAGTLDDGSPYLLMELLEGQSLDVVLRWNGRLDAGVAVQLVLQVCDAVSAAHAAGIIHRDLKPENLFLLKKDGHSFIKVLDFGISKFDGSLTGNVKVTDTNTSLGTPLYMSPEQMRASRDVDARSDLYSLAIILYECIAGAPPFVADNFAELAAMALRGEARPLDEVMREIPRPLAQVIAKAMAPDRGQRFESVEAFAEALEPFAGPGVTSLTEVPKKHRVPSQRVPERQPTVSPWGPTDRPDEITASGAQARPTEEATAAAPNDTTQVSRRWPLLVTTTVVAIAAGFFVVRGAVPHGSLNVQATVDPPGPPTSGGTAEAPGGGSAQPTRLAEVPPSTSVLPPVEHDAGAGPPPAVEVRAPGPTPIAARTAGGSPGERRKPVLTGLLQVTCPEEVGGCIVHLPSKETMEAPFMRVPVTNGVVYVTSSAGKRTMSYVVQLSTQGELVKLEARPAEGMLRRIR